MAKMKKMDNMMPLKPYTVSSEEKNPYTYNYAARKLF